jgi:hypothetical protein
MSGVSASVYITNQFFPKNVNPAYRTVTSRFEIVREEL